MQVAHDLLVAVADAQQAFELAQLPFVALAVRQAAFTFGVLVAVGNMRDAFELAQQVAVPLHQGSQGLVEREPLRSRIGQQAVDGFFQIAHVGLHGQPARLRMLNGNEQSSRNSSASSATRSFSAS